MKKGHEGFVEGPHGPEDAEIWADFLGDDMDDCIVVSNADELRQALAQAKAEAEEDA